MSICPIPFLLASSVCAIYSPATALLPIPLFPLLGVMPVAAATAPFAHELIFLFMGGFLIALAMQRWGLHRRIALRVAGIGLQPRRLVLGFMVATAFLSMWISNTATTVTNHGRRGFGAGRRSPVRVDSPDGAPHRWLQRVRGERVNTLLPRLVHLEVC